MATAKRPVYTVTNFDTRIVVAVYMDSTVDLFKEEFESAHLNCFPEFGKIRVDDVMVQKKSCFYHLPNLFPLKNAFDSSKDWFLHVVAQPLQNQSASTKNTARLKRKKWKKGAKFLLFKTFSRAVYSKRKYNKCRTRKIKDSDHKVKDFGGNLRAEKECLSDSEAVSVSSIIDRYFSGYDQVSSKSTLHSHVQYETKLKLLEEKPRTSIGVRVVKASKSFGLSTTKNTLASSLSKHIRRPIFEFSCENE